MAAHQAPPSLGFSRQEQWSGLPFPSPMHESEKWKGSRLVVSDSLWSHGLQPTRLLRPWDFPGKSTGVGCHCLLWNFSLRGPNPLCTLFSSTENPSFHIKWGIPLFYNHSFSLEWPQHTRQGLAMTLSVRHVKDQWMSTWMKEGRTKPSFAFLKSNDTLLTSSRQSIRIVWLLRV